MGLTDLLFKEKEDKYLKQIEDLQNYLRIQEDQITNLKLQLEEVTKERDARINSKQLEIFEKNFKHNIEVAKKYRSIIDSYNLDTEKKSYKYRVDLKHFYSEKKFEEVVKFLNEDNKFFVDELNEEIFDNINKEVKNTNRAKQRFLDFKNGKMEWAITTLINKGEELSKVYSKSRKLMTIFSELYFEYLDDIANFDFMTLKSHGFNVSEIEDFILKREYYKKIAKKIVYTGAIDEYFDFIEGELEYRSLKFDTKILECNNFQGNAVVNYTGDTEKYTRVIEHKHFEFGNQEKTVVTYEYPDDYEKGKEAYYCINDEKNNMIYEKYKKLAEKEENVIFGGRLAEYKYYDMDDVIKASMDRARKELEGML